MFRATGCIGKYSSTRMCALYFDSHLGKVEKCYIPSLRLCGCPGKEEREQCNYAIPVVTLASQYNFKKDISETSSQYSGCLCNEQKLMTSKLSMGSHIAAAPRIQGRCTPSTGAIYKEDDYGSCCSAKIKATDMYSLSCVCQPLSTFILARSTEIMRWSHLKDQKKTIRGTLNSPLLGVP